MDIETWHGDMEFQTGNEKRKPRRFSLIRLPFGHCANGSLSFVHLLTKKETERICPSMLITNINTKPGLVRSCSLLSLNTAKDIVEVRCRQRPWLTPVTTNRALAEPMRSMGGGGGNMCHIKRPNWATLETRITRSVRKTCRSPNESAPNSPY